MPRLSNKYIHAITQRSRTLGMATVILLGSSTVWAFGPPGFADFDADGDGAISEQEFNQFRAQRMGGRATEGRPMRNAGQGPAFADFDADGNGSISPEELSAMQGGRMGGRGMGSAPMGGKMPEMAGGGNQQCDIPGFEAMDADKDGYISEEELYRFRGLRMSERGMQGFPMRNAGNAPMFEDMDSDGDKRLSPQEFQQSQQAHMQEHARGGMMGMPGDLSVESAWVRATAPGAKTQAAYMVISNKAGAPRALVSATSPDFNSIMLHSTVTEKGMTKMVHQKQFAVPSGGQLVLEPNANHLMLMGPKRQLKAGDTVMMTLGFDNGDRLVQMFEVR